MKLPLIAEKFILRFSQSKKESPMSSKEKWMIFLLAGLLLAVIVIPTEKKDSEPLLREVPQKNNSENIMESYSGEVSSVNQYEQYLSAQLEQILSEIDGAGNVQAWVTLCESGEKVFFKETNSEKSILQEADSVGGSRTEETGKEDFQIVTDSAGNPYVIKTLQPKVEGVLVVAEGAGDSTVKKNISEACEVLFGLDAHRIKVVKKKVEE